jgi:LuxR family maltose regulon positive regulatory protein
MRAASTQPPSSSHASATATPVLAATKLHIPARRPRSVPRSHLARMLSGGDARLILIDAPAGSGKTSLLSEWHADPEESRPFAWISLDDADNDPVRFWDGVIAALQTIDETLGVDAHAALRSAGATVEDLVLPLLINDLAGLQNPIVLVLDDYHVIENDEIHGPLELLIERLPSSAQLVIATRSDPPLPLSRWRARGHLLELRAEQLRFSPAEADAFLNDVLGLDLDSGEIMKLHDRTEGWAAGLQLAGLSLRGRADRVQFIDSFAGDDQQIVDYLGYEVLDRQSPDVRAFLLRSSILDRLCGPLCAAVTGDEGAEQVLRGLDRQNLFVVALDSRREWYRYHHLFADLLRHELTRTAPDRLVTLHRRASDWYRDAGAIHEAIDHATAGGDFPAAIELITTHWYEFLQQGRRETVNAWIDRLPPQTVNDDPILCLTKASLAVNAGRLDEADRWTDAADGAAARRPQPPGEAPLSAGAASLRSIHRYLDGDVGAAVAAGRHAIALERGGPESPWRPVGCPILGLSLHWTGHSGDGARRLNEAVVIAKDGGNRLATVHAGGGLAAISLEQGDLAQAEAYASEALRLAAEYELSGHWATALSIAIQGEVREARGELQAADELLTRAVELARRGLASVEIGYTLLRLANVRQRLGRYDEARALEEEARVAVARCTDPGILAALLRGLQRRLQLTPRRDRVTPSDTSPIAEPLSEAELSVLRLLRSELSQREIGNELHLSVNTIKSHTRSIYRKLGVASREDALDRARRLSLV